MISSHTLFLILFSSFSSSSIYSFIYFIIFNYGVISIKLYTSPLYRYSALLQIKYSKMLILIQNYKTKTEYFNEFLKVKERQKERMRERNSTENKHGCNCFSFFFQIFLPFGFFEVFYFLSCENLKIKIEINGKDWKYKRRIDRIVPVIALFYNGVHLTTDFVCLSMCL